jgi:hypothetical protein
MRAALLIADFIVNFRSTGLTDINHNQRAAIALCYLKHAIHRLDECAGALLF